MKKLMLSSLLVLALSITSFAAENTTENIKETAEVQIASNSITGRVIDKNTNEVLAGVTVFANGQKVYTDFDGKFIVPNLCGNKCTIVISQISYEPQTVELNLNNASSLNVLLSKR